MQRARHYREEKEKIRCLLCPHFCLLAEGQTGTCSVREVVDGGLFTLNYGCLAAAHLDPIEKKPLYHFYPGQQILSLGTYGCNLLCSFCQNYQLARGKPGCRSDQLVGPQDVLGMLKSEGGPKKSLGVAYTYNEPSIWYEFVYDTASLLHGHGYRNVLVTNGYINREPLLELLPFIDAMNIDLKAFTAKFYRDHCHGRLEPVKTAIETAVQFCHVEVTCLLIPTLNDNPDEHLEMARWLGELSPDLVLHYSRYFPSYRLDLPPTPPSVLENIRDLARRYLRYVYLGNIELPHSSHTTCPHCGNLLIKRSGYSTEIVGMNGLYCSNCQNRIAIVLPERNRQDNGTGLKKKKS